MEILGNICAAESTRCGAHGLWIETTDRRQMDNWSSDQKIYPRINPDIPFLYGPRHIETLTCRSWNSFARDVGSSLEANCMQIDSRYF